MFALAFACAVFALSTLDVRAESFHAYNGIVRSPSNTAYAHSQITAPPPNPRQDLRRQITGLASNSTVKTCGWVNNMAGRSS